MITDFLRYPFTQEELTAALKILHVFKECESEEEFLAIPFYAWCKLEQLQEFLEHRVEGKPLKSDTVAYMQRRS